MKTVYRIRVSPSTVHNLKNSFLEVHFHESHKAGEYFVSAFSLKHLKDRRIPYKVLRSYSNKEVPVRIDYPSHARLYEPPQLDAVHEVMAKALSQKNRKGPIQVLYMGRRNSLVKNYFILDRPGGRRSYQWQIPIKSKKIQDIRNLFPNIKKQIKDPNTKVILSLGSGGIRLFAHATLLKFIDLLNLRPHIDEIWGSSGGAIAGLLYSMGVEPSTMEQEGYHLYNERYSFRFSPSKLEVALNLLADFLFPTSDNMLKGFMDCQNALKGLMEKYIGEHKPKIPFFCIAYNLIEKRNEILTPERINAKHYLNPILHTDALDAVIASSSIPILYVPKKILRGKTEHLYIDGGTTEEVPLISPYEKWVHDRIRRKEKKKKLLIISVNLFPQVGTSKLFTNWIFKKLPVFRILQVSAIYADLIRQARIEDHKNRLHHDRSVTLWNLTFPLPGAGILNTQIIPKIIETAQSSFFKQLMNIEKEL